MIAQLPLLLALSGTALTALAIFAPARIASDDPVVSFAPQVAAPLGRWSSSHVHEAHVPAAQVSEPIWPELVDASARACDAATRVALVEALATVRAPWADAILHQAQAEESHARVRAALDAALGG